MAERNELEVTLAVAYEPPSESPDLFGLDEDALRRVAALALARVGITQPVEISVLVTSDEGLRTLNRDFRGRDEATDVLSFPLLDAPLVDAPEDQLWQPPDEEPPPRGPLALDPPLELLLLDPPPFDDDLDTLDDDDDAEPWADEASAEGEMPLHLGDIALSREAITRQAARAEHSAAWELAYLLAHGVLHLVGYDDHTDAGYAAMVAHQEAVLAAAGIPR